MKKQYQEASKSDPDNKKDILVSIGLTESTSSLLQLDLPRVEKLDAEGIEHALAAAKANNEASQHDDNSKSSKFTNFWFGEEIVTSKRSEDSKEVSQEVAYFSDDPRIGESLSSIEFDSDNRRHANSTTVLSERLKATTVYTNPLVSVKSLPDSNLLATSSHDTKANDSDSEWSNVCRICHGGESNGNLVSPCNCRGSIAMAHLECLERWLKESSNSQCELCKHEYVVIREPKYSIPKSIYLFLRHPGDHLSELLFDLFAFIIYTPAAIVSTYMLVLLCETVAKSHLQYSRSLSTHIVTLSAVLGMAAIDFTYSSWLMINLQKHCIAWKHWYRNNSKIKVILPEEKQTNVVNANEDDDVD